MPAPQHCTRGQENTIDHGISHKLKIFHYYKTLAISTQIMLFLEMFEIFNHLFICKDEKFVKENY
jgi:hypothetical protein